MEEGIRSSSEAAVIVQSLSEELIAFFVIEGRRDVVIGLNSFRLVDRVDIVADRRVKDKSDTEK